MGLGPLPIHTSTFLSSSPSTILTALSRISTTLKRKRPWLLHTTLFSLSTTPTLSSKDLSSLVDALNELTEYSVGCLSAPLPSASLGSKSSKRLNTKGKICASVAIFRSEDTRVFRTDIAGRPPVQVGRWHAYRMNDGFDWDAGRPSLEDMGEEGEGKVDWEDIWARNAAGNVFPEGLKGLEEERINSVLFFADNASEGLTNALSSLPNARTLGLIASSTPFITGRPVTLFHNDAFRKDSIHSAGAVGLALLGASEEAPKIGVEFQGLRPISGLTSVTRSEGNLIQQLSDQGKTKNPTQLLLDTIKANGIDVAANTTFKDEEQFYVGVIKNNEVCRVLHIMSGDPSRGPLALASDKAPPKGALIQFLHRPKSTAVHLPQRFLWNKRKGKGGDAMEIGFMVASQEPGPEPELATGSEAEAEEDGDGEEDLQILKGKFVVASENGFIVNDLPGSENESGTSSGTSSWRCTAPGSVASLRW